MFWGKSIRTLSCWTYFTSGLTSNYVGRLEVKMFWLNSILLYKSIWSDKVSDWVIFRRVHVVSWSLASTQWHQSIVSHRLPKLTHFKLRNCTSKARQVGWPAPLNKTSVSAVEPLTSWTAPASPSTISRVLRLAISAAKAAADVAWAASAAEMMSILEFFR